MTTETAEIIPSPLKATATSSRRGLAPRTEVRRIAAETLETCFVVPNAPPGRMPTLYFAAVSKSVS